MKNLIMFAMRDFIGKVIKHYIQHLRDENTRESDVERIESVFQHFESWLYLTMKRDA